MLTGTVRTSALFRGQPEQTRPRIRAAFDRQVLEHQRGDQFELPVSVKLALGAQGGMTGGKLDKGHALLTRTHMPNRSGR
jgi:hypothetical protein